MFDKKRTLVESRLMDGLGVYKEQASQICSLSRTANSCRTFRTCGLVLLRSDLSDGSAREYRQIFDLGTA